MRTIHAHHGTKTLGDVLDSLYIENVMVKHLIANGVIVPPCKVGDTVYYINGRYERKCQEKMSVNSRRKGADFERKLANILKEYGYSARRGQQYSGANGDADVVGLPHVHIEAKAVEKLNIYDAMEQSKRDARPLEIPVVIHKKNRRNILVTMELDEFMKMYKEFEKGVNVW